jgi:DNA-binding response OmpR family regulator
MLTALADEASRKRGIESGASVYLNKPFDPDRFLSVIQQLTSESGRFA